MTEQTRDRAEVFDAAFATMQRWGVRIIVLAAATLVFGWVIGHTWIVLFPIALALIICTVLSPPVMWMRRHRVPGALASAVTLIAFIGLVTGSIALLAPQVAGQAGEVADKTAGGLQKVRDWLSDGPLHLSNVQINDAIGALQDQLKSSATEISAGVFSTIGTATSIVFNLIIVLMLTFLFLKDGHKFLPWVQNVSGQRVGGHLVGLLERVWNTLGGFIRIQTLVSLIDAALIGIALVIVGVPLAFPLAVVTFFAGYIPIVGAVIGGALAVLVTLVTNSPGDALIILLVVVVVHQLEGNVLSPWLQGKSMKLHAAIVLLSVMAGSSIFGITGAFLAVPVAATVAEVLRYCNEQVDAAAVDEPAAPAGSSTAAGVPDVPATEDG